MDTRISVSERIRQPLSGFFWVNPFYQRMTLSLRARNFESEKVKVNDKMGNPIMISVILVWRVGDTYQASFEVDDCGCFCTS